jgi:valyl-tRNA synthetase
VHLASWPEPLRVDGDPAVLEAASEALIGIRRAKTDAKVSQRTPVASARITGPEDAVSRLALVAGDVGAAGRISALSFGDGSGSVAVTDVVFASPDTEQGGRS